MNTTIYCEIDQDLVSKIHELRTSLDQPAKDVLKSPFAKWFQKTKKWRERCLKRIQEKRWSAKKEIWIAPIK